MTTPFRIDAITIATSGGPVGYSFPSSLTVLAGSVGVGKSTLFELIKYGLGGDALLADVVTTSVSSVTVEISVAREKYSFNRSTSPKERARVKVFDLKDRASLPDHFTDKREPSLSSLLLTSMGLPDDMRAAARAPGSTNQGARVTFNDVFKYMYVSQADINEEIAGSGQSYYQPKRKAVFEILFALTNPEILQIQSTIAKVRGDWDQAKHDFSVVFQFLKDSNTQHRIDAERGQLEASRQREQAVRELTSVREAIYPAIDRETQTLRDLLGESERNTAHAQNALAMLAQQKTDFIKERSLVRQDIDRIRRLMSAGRRLAEIEFAVCPRCMQDVQRRTIPDHACRLCLQPDPVEMREPASLESSYELDHLSEQIEELSAQIQATEAEIAATTNSLDSRRALVVQLSSAIDSRTRERITPQLQAFSDATSKLANAEALNRELEKTLSQWDRADDLKAHALSLEELLKDLKEQLKDAEALLETRRDEVFDELDAEFSETVASIGIPGVSTAALSRDSYLPVLNGKPFESFSPVGGVRTATQVAYWVALITVALRRRDTFYPAFLLMDSPRTSLNDNDDLSSALYRRLVMMADAAEGRLQVIIGDNELPVEYRRHYAQLNFDYERPTISTIHHPGREAVRTLYTGEGPAQSILPTD